MIVSAPVKRLLIIRPGAIGDFIVSLPALEHLSAGYREVWTASSNVPLARFADAAHSIASTGLDLLGLPGVDPPPRLLDRLRAFDRIDSWYGANRPEFRRAVESLPFRFFTALPPEQGSAVPASEFYWRQAGHPGSCPPTSIDCGAPPREPYAVLHPFAASSRKRWPLDRFRALARILPYPSHFCAGPDDELEGAVRYENLYDLACWIARARVFIGNDSGITHLAAAAGTPTVALFGPTDPRVWAPLGPHVTVLHGLDSLTPEAVAAAVPPR